MGTVKRVLPILLVIVVAYLLWTKVLAGRLKK